LPWSSGVPRGGVWGVQIPPPKFWRPSKIVPNLTRLWKLLKTAAFRTPTHQDVRKKGSKILKLPRLAMTNKLVVIINSFKIPKIKKLRPQIPVLSVLCPQLNLLNHPPPPKKIPGYATAMDSGRSVLMCKALTLMLEAAGSSQNNATLCHNTASSVTRLNSLRFWMHLMPLLLQKI
jgi:hypothetical protein